MREDNWYKWFFIAMLLHVLIIGAFSVPFKHGSRKVDLSSYYSVNLVGDMGGSEAPKASVPEARPQVSKPVPPPPKLKAQQKKAKDIPPPPTASEKARSLTPAKKPMPESTAKDDVRRLDKRIREMQQTDTTSIDEKIKEMRKKVQYVDVATGAGRGQGSGLLSSGGSTPLDPTLARYYAEVQEAIQSAWHNPLSSKKDLVTLVTVTIRKDGRITDWQVDQRSGNRTYDEAVARALRSVDKVPPIPPSLNTDSIQLGFRFRPGDGG
jgi:TonB family protein